MTTRRYFVVSSLSIAALIPISAGLTRTAHAQDNAVVAPATAERPQRAPRIDPIATAVTVVNPTDAVKTQIDAIVEKYRKEREALTPAPTAGQPAERPQLTPEQREQIAASEAKEVAEIKAALTADQQTKFQTAYDAAKIAQASAPALALLSEKLSLTDDEKTKVTPIITEYTEQSQKLRQDTTLDQDARRAKLTALWDAAKVKIRPLLTADQQTTLDGITSLRGGRRNGQ